MHLSTLSGAKRLCSTKNSVAQKEGQNFSYLALLAYVYDMVELKMNIATPTSELPHRIKHVYLTIS